MRSSPPVCLGSRVRTCQRKQQRAQLGPRATSSAFWLAPADTAPVSSASPYNHVAPRCRALLQRREAVQNLGRTPDYFGAFDDLPPLAVAEPVFRRAAWVHK